MIYEEKNTLDKEVCNDMISWFDNKTLYGDTGMNYACLLYTSPSPRDGQISRMPSSA